MSGIVLVVMVSSRIEDGELCEKVMERSLPAVTSRLLVGHPASCFCPATDHHHF